MIDEFHDAHGDRLLWLAVGVLVTGLVALTLYGYVGILVTAIFLYYATRPIYQLIDDHVPYSNASVVLTLTVVLVPMAFVIVYALFLIAVELDSVLAGGRYASLREYAQPYLSLANHGQFRELAAAISESGNSNQESANRALRLGSSVFDVASLAFEVLAEIFLLSVFLFYLLRDGHLIREWFYEAVDHDPRVVEFTQIVDDDLETVFFNNLVLVVLTAIEAAVFYAALNLLAPGGAVVDTPVLLGALVGIGTIIPVVGMKIVYLPYAVALGILAATGDAPLWHPLAFLAVSAVVIDTIPDVFVRTYLSARGTIHMGLILLGYVLGTMAFGWYGLFLGPIVVVVFYHFAHGVFPWLASSYLEAEEANR